jgi:hypothetical protein
MKNSLPRWSAAVLLLIGSAAIALQSDSIAGTQLAQAADRPASPPQASPLSSGDQLLVQALNQLDRRRSATARLSHQISLRGEQLNGRGSYWQQGSGDDLRIRLELQIVGQESSLLQVSNSRSLWVDRRLPIGRTVTQINLRQLRNDPVLTADSFDEIRPGEASWSPTQPDLLACYGGLPHLLASLGSNFAFMPPQAMRLVSPGAPPQASPPYFAVVGHWKPEKLALLRQSLAPKVEEQQAEAEDSLPERFPKEVLLLFGQADLFPYRIEYRQRETSIATGDNAAAATYQLSANPMVVLEFSEVAFDVPIAAGQFDYAPGDVDWVDQTAAVLERLHRDRQAKMATRSLETQPPMPR